MLTTLGTSFAQLEGASSGGEFSAFDVGGIIPFGNAVPSEVLQLVVGIYVIEILILLAIFINRISVGYDIISEHDTIWKMVLVGVIVYVVVIGIISIVFMPLINAATTMI